MRVEKKFSNAFTLAEVLITLGIIGVVAAMTMPTLINQTNGAQYKAAYKKALSVISQAVTLNVALDDIGFAETSANSDTTNSSELTLAGLLRGRINVINAVAGTPADHTITGSSASIASTNVSLYFNDGSMISFPSTAQKCGAPNGCTALIDVNGKKGPNKLTTDSSSPADVYPVRIYDQTIVPNSNAAREVLYK